MRGRMLNGKCLRGTNEVVRNKRDEERMVLRKWVTATFYHRETALAYGVVINISKTGACLVTNTAVGPGWTGQLALSVYPRPDVFETEACVVWSGQNGSEEPVHGIRFTRVPSAKRRELRELLKSNQIPARNQNSERSRSQ